MHAVANEPKNENRTALGVSGLRSFTRLDSSSQAPRRFRKEVLRVGEWEVDGQPLAITHEKLSRLVANTQRWLELGHKVGFPNGHTDDALENLGWWSSFELEGDRAFGIVEVFSDELAQKLGTTITDVSPGIWWNARSTTGEDLVGGVLEHVCATPVPVQNSQPNFVRLAREITPMSTPSEKAPETETKTAPRAKPDKVALAKGAAPGVGVADAVKLFLGLGADASDEDTIAALRSELMDDDEDEDEEDAEEKDELPGEQPIAGAGMATMSREAKHVAELTRQLKSLNEERAREKVHAAKVRSAELGSPIPIEDLKEAESLLSRGDAEGKRLGERLLEANLRAALSSSKRPGAGRDLPSPGVKDADEARLAKHQSLARGFRSQGMKVETDAKGLIVRVNDKAFEETRRS